jgi:hypothetical protein
VVWRWHEVLELHASRKTAKLIIPLFFFISWFGTPSASISWAVTSFPTLGFK